MKNCVSRVCAVLAVLVTQACSSSEDVETGDEVQAGTSDWIHPACDASALSQPGGNSELCNGPWKYQYQEWWRDFSCGEDPNVCTRHNACESWDRDNPGDGLGYTVANSIEDNPFHSNTCVDFGPCNAYDGDTVCPAEADARKNALIAARPGISTPALNGFTVTWEVANYQYACNFNDQTGIFDCIDVYHCRLHINNFPTPVTAEHPWCSCAQHGPAECQRGAPVTAFTEPGANKSLIDPGPPGPGSTRRTVAGILACTTCDPLAVDTDTAVQDKFTCYDQGLGTENGALHSSLIARMKLLFQLSGERLTGAQRTRVEQIYDQDPDSAPSCSVALPWESSCKTQAATLGLPTQLQLCQDLTRNDHTSTGAASAELQHCLDQLAKVNQLSPDTCRLPVRDMADGAAQGVLGKTYPALGGDLVALLPPVLTRMSAWWTAATTAAGGDQAWLLGHANTVLRQLWTNIERAKIPLPSGDLSDDTAAAALLANITGTGFTDDFNVLSAVFAAGQSSPPFILTLAGDALQPIADRLVRLEALHDVGCRFADPDCRTVSAGGVVTLRSSATSELVHALSVLPDSAAFATALGAASHLSSQQPVLYAALTRIRDQHGYLEAAWSALGRTDPFSQLATVTDVPAEASALAGIVRTAVVAWGSYQGSGVFAPWHRARLTSAALQQPALVAFVDSLRGAVTGARATYEQQRLGLVNDLLAQSRQTGTTQSAKDRMAALRDQDGDLVSRFLGLESREADQRRELATFQIAFEALINSGALDADAAYQVFTLPPVQATAADAHYPGLPLVGDVTRDRIPSATVTLHSGESLRLQITGEWTPTCAVLHSQIPGPDGNFEPIEVADAKTGPEGYWVSRTSDNFSGHSTSTTTNWRLDLGVAIKECYAHPFLGLSIEVCAHQDFDYIHSNTGGTSDGGQSRSSASFASGIRLPNTPYPEAAAGSLVAVITRSGHPEDVREVRVVQRNDLILAPALPDGLGDLLDVSFVVNDLGTCGGGTADVLQINGVKSVPFGNTAKAIGSAMASTLKAIEDQAPAILAQGQLTAEEGTALRASAWTRVDQALTALGISLAGLPYDLHQLFDSFLEAEIASIARRGQMHGIARERVQLGIAATGVAHELEFSNEQNRLLLLIPRWRLRDLSGVQLATADDALAEALSTDVAQVYELRDPAGFTQFRATVVQQTGPLIDVSLTAPYETSVQSFEDFATAARNALAAAPFELPSDFRRNIVVAIPRNPATCPGGPCVYKNTWTSVSNSAAAAFWSAIAAAPFAASVTITPTDLYSSLGTGTLACSDMAPVIRRMAMYLDTKASTIDLRTTFLEVSGAAATSGSQVLFPLVGKVLALEADAAAGVALSPPVVNGSVTQVSDRFGPSPNQLGTGAGLSPFTKMNFDMTPFQSGIPKDALTVADAVLLVFEVERRLSTSPVQVVGPCVAPAP